MTKREALRSAENKMHTAETENTSLFKAAPVYNCQKQPPESYKPQKETAKAQLVRSI